MGGSYRPLIVEMADAQFPDVLLMARQHGNRGRAPIAMALENSTYPRNVRNGGIDAPGRPLGVMAQTGRL